MAVGDILQIAVVLVALVGPVLVYLNARAKLNSDHSINHDANTWERMANLVDRYGSRADELESRLEAAEAHAEELSTQVGRLRAQLNQWRAFAQALFQQVLDESITPVDPAEYGITDWDA